MLLRPWLPDGPTQSLPAADSAVVRVDAALYAIGDTPYDCLVLTNEVVWRSTEYAVTWIHTAIDYAAQRGVTCLVPVVWAPGHPELSDVPALAAAYANAPIDVAWGINAYPTVPGVDLSTRGGLNEYTVQRWRMYADQLPPGVQIIVTEAAAGEGNDAPDWLDIGRFVAQVDGELYAVTFWYDATCGAGLGNWPRANLCGQLSGLAKALTLTP